MNSLWKTLLNISFNLKLKWTVFIKYTYAFTHNAFTHKLLAISQYTTSSTSLLIVKIWLYFQGKKLKINSWTASVKREYKRRLELFDMLWELHKGYERVMHCYWVITWKPQLLHTRRLPTAMTVLRNIPQPNIVQSSKEVGTHF